MASSPAHPLPPANFDSRPLPIVSVSGEWFRVHKLRAHLRDKGALYFGNGAVYRFDDFKRAFGVLYLAEQGHGAFIETLGRSEDRSANPLFRSELEIRRMARVEVADLNLVDLTSTGLAQIGADNRLSTDMDYDATRAWARAFHEHPEQPDGIRYRSRNDPSARCVAVFERAREKVTYVVSALIYHRSDPAVRRKLNDYLQRYGFAFDETK